MVQVSKEGDTFEVPVEIAKLSNLVVTTLGGDDAPDGEEGEEEGGFHGAWSGDWWL